MGTGTRETEVRLNGWCEGGFREQRNDSGGWSTMRKRPERVESPGTYVIECGHFCLACILVDHSPMLWWLSHGEGRDAVT